MKDFSFVTNSHPGFVEELYKDFVNNPTSVDPELKKFFEGFDFAVSQQAQATSVSTNASTPVSSTNTPANLEKEFSVYQLIRAYRKRGHLISETNPIRKRKDRHANLDLHHFGLTEADLEKEFNAGIFCGIQKTKLKDIVEYLKAIYTAAVGIEFTYINNEEICSWVQNEFEKVMMNDITLEKKKRILEKLNEGVIFEKFLHTKFIGQKRFSLEGGESTIAALDAIISEAAEHDVKEVVMGMAHRGRFKYLSKYLTQNIRTNFY